MFDLAIYYRMAGGFVGLGSTVLTRIRWGLTVAFYMTFVGLVHHDCLFELFFIFVVTALMGYAGRLIPHSAFQSVASVRNSMGMVVVTLIRLSLILIPYYCAGWLVGYDLTPERFLSLVWAIGAGVGYYVGNKYLNGKDYGVYYRAYKRQFIIPSVATVAAAVCHPVPYGTTLDQCAVGGTEWGELLTGYSYQAFYMTLMVLS